MAIGRGILAVLNDCAPGAEQDYEAWYLSEHLPERLSIDGFRWGRRYRALPAAGGELPEYLTYYETRDPAVLSSAAYLDRVNNPTAETSRIMSHVFTNMVRTVCRRTGCAGQVRTAWVVLAVTDRPIDGDLTVPSRFPTLWREAWENAEPDDGHVSKEEVLRGGDAKIVSAILQDCADADDALQVARLLHGEAGLTAAAFGLIGSIERADS
ncbi:MAG: hypothetical protein AAGD13_12755 [Pseudomonadota bacterium]